MQKVMILTTSLYEGGAEREEVARANYVREIERGAEERAGDEPELHRLREP